MTHPLTPREKVELKPCSFCGGEAVAGSNFDNDHYVMCGADCDRCGGMVGYMKTEMAAIENRNRRAALASSGDHAELARLAVVATDAASLGDGLQEAALTRFQAHANPATVLALIAENAALRGRAAMADVLGEKLERRTLALDEAERKLAEAAGLLAEAASELESEVEARYDGVKDHPAMTPKYDRDMDTPQRINAWLSKEAERG